MGRTRLTISLRLSSRVKKMAPQLMAKAMTKPNIQLRFSCLTRKVTTTTVIMNKAYFDSLKMCENPKYPRPDNHIFRGVHYRSAAEKEIAIFYTEMGIPFVYEPDVMIKGLVKTINPDFVLYIKELDTCKFHEHFGMRDYSDYLSNTKQKCSNFANAGLGQDIDVLFTYGMDDTWFDPWHMMTILNSAICGTICMDRQKKILE